ncbi:MAG: hypothetical protein ABI895_17670, partial [Deltaproteobacteria bacterium]
MPTSGRGRGALIVLEATEDRVSHDDFSGQHFRPPARNLLQHELPGRDLAEVQRRALELLVHKLRQRKHAASERPRSSAPATTCRRPPAQKSATRS